MRKNPSEVLESLDVKTLRFFQTRVFLKGCLKASPKRCFVVTAKCFIADQFLQIVQFFLSKCGTLP